MTAVWSIDLPASQKIVLLALADCANDEGHAWPGMASLSKKCSKSERTVQAMLAELEAAGHLTRNQVPGKGCNYIVHPRNSRTPEKSAPPQKLPKTPAKSAPKPLGTAKGEKAKASSPKRERSFVGWPDLPTWLPAEPWAGFLDMRWDKRAWPTARAAKLLIAELDGWRAKGHDPGKILNNSTMNNWTGLFEPKDPPNGTQRNGFSGQGSTRELGMDVARELAQRRAGGSVVDLLPGPGSSRRALG